MKKIMFIMMFCVTLGGMAQKTNFSKEALAEQMKMEDGTQITFEKILKKYKGKVVVIDIWASWCADCIKGMPEVKKLQAAYNNTVFLFLSLDKTEDSWKSGIKKYDVKGEHYYIQKGWRDSAFCSDVELDWIPRYMIIDKKGKISFYKAIHANDKQLINHLKSLQ